MKFSTLLTAFAGSYFVLVLLKDGTLPKVINDAARGAGDLATGLRPITRVG